jgi:hypothetical protein
MLFHPDFKRRLTRISIVLAGVVGFAASIAEIRTHLLGRSPSRPSRSGCRPPWWS